MLTHAAALRLAPVRIGVRAHPGESRDPEPCAAVAHFRRDAMRSGGRDVGPLHLELRTSDHRDSATFALSLSNPGTEPVFVESVCLGFHVKGFHTEGLHAKGLEGEPLRFLRNGWQSWSFTGTRPLDAKGEPEFPSGPWLRGMHHAINATPGDRAGWHQSASVSAVGGGPGSGACVAGVLETGRCFGLVYLCEDRHLAPQDRLGLEGGVRIEVELIVEVPLYPGESRELDAVRVALGDDPNRLLEQLARLWGREAGARTESPFRLGWCSWYHFFHDVSECDILRNLEALASARGELPVEVVQIDDGFQRAIGDWTETNEKFPRGLAPLAADIVSAGFTPGLWTAPFCVVSESHLFEAHPEWLLRDGEHLFRGTLNDVWTKERWVHALDTTQPEVVAHIEAIFRDLVGMGFGYLKLDFLHVAAMRADASDPRVTRAERLREGLRAVRRGAGEDAFLLGCGSPMGPAVGIVDAMRIGPDVAPYWEADPTTVLPGLERTLPSTKSAVRSIVHRAWMHRNLWLNDPDCLMARSDETKLSREEVRTLAVAIAATGGMLVFSDDVSELDADSRALVRECAEIARRVDAGSAMRAPQIVDLLRDDDPGLLLASRGVHATVGLLNTKNAPRSRVASCAELSVAASPQILVSALESAPRVIEGELRAELASHQSAIAELDSTRRLAVFCDFDGTFSLQDIGSTLARERLPELRASLQLRIESGELDAWSYTALLLDGFEIPEAELDTFLRTIELDPAATALLAWCEKREVPFRILSDGFDRNLDFIQKIHGFRFDYAANRLRYQGDRWQIAPGHPDSRCGCGTGTCKATIISAWRVLHPDAFCVHIGNGYVSDLCGARVSDWAFARESDKDTLAPALRDRGVGFTAFRTLQDVIDVLELLTAPSPGTPR